MRFNEGRRASVKQWINARYEAIWNARPDWDFKRLSGEDMATVVTANGDYTPSMPAAFAEALELYDDQGWPMTYLTPREWEERYLPDIVASTGRARPSEYTVANRQILLGPVPDAAYNLKLAYVRRFCHLDTVGAILTVGQMVEDGDVPVWEGEHHYLLVVEAMLMGSTLQRGADIAELKQQRDELMASMLQDHCSGTGGKPLQYGRR